MLAVNSVAQHFESFVDRNPTTTGCHEWTGAASGGRAYYWKAPDGAPRGGSAARVAWSLATGQPIPTGMMVCHRCDNKMCVRPDHLFLGTPRDNVMDMWSKGRAHQIGHAAKACGEAHGSSKLAESDVLEIRARYAAGGISHKTLGAQFGVSAYCVLRIVRRLNWSHV